MNIDPMTRKEYKIIASADREMCQQLYRIVDTSINSIVGYDHITILMLKAEETYLSATHYSDGLKGSCVYQVHRSKEYLSAYWS